MREMNGTNSLVAIGIDPGADGALAVLWPDGAVDVRPFDRRGYIDALSCVTPRPEDGRVVCVLEHVGAMPGQGSVSTFSFGRNFGWIQGILDARRIPYELVRPQKWKREFSCTSDKNTSIAVAERLFPSVDLRRTPRCRRPHDGVCEALLMAEYARRHFNVG